MTTIVTRPAKSIFDAGSVCLLGGLEGGPGMYRACSVRPAISMGGSDPFAPGPTPESCEVAHSAELAP